MAQQVNDEVVVYQAYNKEIAEYSVENSVLGGPGFSYSRMSWIKPNFLWMMFRSGWARKENQERILAIWLKKESFLRILDEAVISSYDARLYSNHQQWEDDMKLKNVRLQWDPDHDPFGNKITRRAIQLGLKGDTLENFGKRDIQLIEDTTDFVKEGHTHVRERKLDQLYVPFEKPFLIEDKSLQNKIGVD